MTGKKTIFLTIFLILFATGIFFSLNPTIASVVSQNYKKYKAKYKNKEDKQNYFKFKTLRKDNPKLYSYYKSICDVHKFDTQKQFEKLSQKTQDICSQYYAYRGYKQYVHYRNKYRNSDDDETTTTETSFVCGTSTVSDADGNTYSTVLINDQCWMASNLNVGTMLASPAIVPTNNGIIEKWCNGADGSFHSTSGDCSTYGGLYSWDEAMQYSTVEGAQGICPSGWHIPKSEQWYILEYYLWDKSTGTCNNYRDDWGCNLAGTKLKTDIATGFLAQMSGYRLGGGVFSGRGEKAYFLTSNEEDGDEVWFRLLDAGSSMIYDSYTYKNRGMSVRCLKD